MDELLPKLLSFPPHPPPQYPISDQLYEELITAQIDTVKKVPQRTFLLATTSGEHILNVLNPSLNTVPYLFALIANISAFQNRVTAALDGDALWQKIIFFLEQFDPIQIRYVGHEFRQTIARTVNLARHAQQPALAIEPICKAILRLEETGSTLTSTHVLLVQITLETRAFELATSVLDRYILYFPGLSHPTKSRHLCSRELPGPIYLNSDTNLTEKLNTQDVMEYFLLRGTVYIGLRQWKKAADSLETVFTYPVKDNAISKLMVEAYKKWVLVNLLLRGMARSLPTITNSAAAKSYHIIGKPYDIVASLFLSASASRLHAEIQVGKEIWENDRNMGLMHLVLASYQKFQIRRLANVYRTISIAEVKRVTFSAETGANLPSEAATEELILHMINEGELKADIIRGADDVKVLAFAPSDALLSESDVKAQLAESLRRIQSLVEDVKISNRTLTHDKDYLRWAQKQKNTERSGGGDGISAEDVLWNQVDDEDLMGATF